MSSIAYYNLNAKEFFDRTVHVDFSASYAKFLPHLASGAHILDAGCGSGRDTLHFKRLGFEVTAFDASEEMVRLSSHLIGAPTLHLRFQDIDFTDSFDAVWASASMLHVPYVELASIFGKLHLALKPSGILYATFKYGCDERIAGERTFYDMDEKRILPYFDALFTPVGMWTTPDVRSQDPSALQGWLHILIQKKPT